MLSIIVPAYNEAENIPFVIERIDSLMSKNQIEYELLFIDDGSVDKTWYEIKNERTTNVKGIKFSRNFGKESAIYAGLYYAKGDCCVVIDCDLQHPPEKIIDMYELWEQGYEIVEGIKRTRGDESIFHGFAAKCFYTIISSVTGIDMRKTSDFKLLDRKAVLAVLNMKEKNSFFRALSSYVGFKSTQIEFDVEERLCGESKWSTIGLIKYAIANIAAFSSAPMQIVTFLGVIMFFVSILLGGVSLIQKLIGTAIDGFTTIIIIQLFSSSACMISLGIIGFYISKIYEEVKNRPKYIISEMLGESFNETENYL